MTDKIDELWDLLDEFRFAMLTTVDKTMDGGETDHGAEMRARPMASHLDREKGLIHFMSKRTDDKVEEIHDEDDVCLSYMRPDDQLYISVTGRATVSTDRALIERLWDVGAEAWFSGDKKTADVAVITVHPRHAEYWHNDQTAVRRAFEFAKGIVTDVPPEMGDNAKLKLAS